MGGYLDSTRHIRPRTRTRLPTATSRCHTLDLDPIRRCLAIPYTHDRGNMGILLHGSHLAATTSPIDATGHDDGCRGGCTNDSRICTDYRPDHSRHLLPTAIQPAGWQPEPHPWVLPYRDDSADLLCSGAIYRFDTAGLDDSQAPRNLSTDRMENLGRYRQWL